MRQAIKSSDFRYKKPMSVREKIRKPRGIHTFTTYQFTDKDPIIDEIKTVVDASGISYTKIQDDAGVGDTLLWNWFNGNTKRPQNATIRAVLRAIGYDVKIVKAEIPPRGNFAKQAGRHLKVVGGKGWRNR